MEEAIQKGARELSAVFLSWLGDQNSCSSRPVRCRINFVTQATYLINVIRVHARELYIQELITSEKQGQIVYRSWTLRLKEEWEIAGLEKLRRPVHYLTIKKECTDLLARLDVIQQIQAAQGSYFADGLEHAENILSVELPLDRETMETGLFTGFSRFAFRHSAAITAALLLFGIGVLGTVFTIQTASYRREVDRSIEKYTSEIDFHVHEFISGTELEILSLIDDLNKSRKNFEYDRSNAYLNVVRLSEELPRFLPARKEAYQLIAENILSSKTYGEIFFEMGRLPSEEYQARILLATDRQSIKPLARHTPVIPEMLYPVQVTGEENDGKGFRITDGYMTERKDPMGTGGVFPHYAVDIINVNNIAYINYAGEIVRDDKSPGAVIAVYDGSVEETGYDDRYGWYLLLIHEAAPGLKDIFPDSTGWGTFYAHLENESVFSEGDSVSAGEHIGLIGNSGYSTGPHLHFEVWVFHPSGRFDRSGLRFDKVNPYPEEG